MIHERRPRSGFFESRMLPVFKLYPWTCVYCNRLQYRPARTASELRLSIFNS